MTRPDGGRDGRRETRHAQVGRLLRRPHTDREDRGLEAPRVGGRILGRHPPVEDAVGDYRDARHRAFANFRQHGGKLIVAGGKWG